HAIPRRAQPALPGTMTPLSPCGAGGAADERHGTIQATKIEIYSLAFRQRDVGGFRRGWRVGGAGISGLRRDGTRDGEQTQNADGAEMCASSRNRFDHADVQAIHGPHSRAANARKSTAPVPVKRSTEELVGFAI